MQIHTSSPWERDLIVLTIRRFSTMALDGDSRANHGFRMYKRFSAMFSSNLDKAFA